MSIALEARVTKIEALLALAIDTQTNHQQQMLVMIESLRKANERIEELERTAARKPGPKPKDSNG